MWKGRGNMNKNNVMLMQFRMWWLAQVSHIPIDPKVPKLY